MPNVNLSPLDAQQAALNRRRALALALQQQSMEPIASPPVRGAQISPVEGIAKLAQALVGGLSNRRLDKEQAALSDQQQQQRESQAGSLVASLTPPAQGDVVQPDNSGLPLPQLGPQPQQLNPAPQQLDARAQSIKALAAALASQDPMMQKSGEAGLQNLMVSGRDSATQQQEMARLLAGQKFTGSQNDLTRGLTQQQIDIQRQLANQKDNTPVVVPADSSVYDQSTHTFNQAPKTVTPRPVATDREIDTFTSNDGYRVTTYQKPDGTTYERKGSTKVQPPAAAANFNQNNPTEQDSTVKYIADQVRDNPLNWSLTAGNKTLQNQVRTELAKGEDVNRLTASTRQLGETADTIVPKIDSTIKRLDDPKFIANLGPAMGRWNEFLTGKYGSNDPDLANLRATLSLMQTGVMRAHVGARGGEGLLDKFEGLIDGKKMDAATLKGSLTGIRDFLQGYRDRIHPTGTNTGGGKGGLVLPPDIRAKVMGQ